MTPPLLCAIGLHCYREVGAGQSIHRYIACKRCGDRQVLFAKAGFQAVRSTWLAGGSWDDQPPSGLP